MACAVVRSLVWRWNPGIAVLVVLLLPATLGLGLWQMQRAEQKRALMAMLEKPPMLLTDNATPPADASVVVHGRFVEQLFAPGQVHEGRAGYRIYGLFQPAGGGRRILVERGWLADGARWRSPPGEVWLSGIMRRRLPRELRRGGPGGALARTDELAVRSRMLRLSADSPYRYALAASAPPMPPEHHLGYALQWFGLALVLVVGGIWAQVRRA